MPRDFAGWKQTSPRKGTSKCPLITLVPLKDSGNLLISGEGSFRSKMMEEGGQAYHSHPSLARKGDVQTLNHSKKKALEPFSLSPTPTNPSEVLLMLGPMKIPNLWVSSHLPTELPSVKLILVFSLKGPFDCKGGSEFLPNRLPFFSSKTISSWANLPSNSLWEGTLLHEPPQKDFCCPKASLTGSTKGLTWLLQSQLQVPEDSDCKQGPS